MIFTLLGCVIDSVCCDGDDKIINDNGTVSIEISDSNIISKYISPLCEREITHNNVFLNFRENPINGRCELSSISFGEQTCEVGEYISDEVARLSINELYHTMCERIML